MPQCAYGVSEEGQCRGDEVTLRETCRQDGGGDEARARSCDGDDVVSPVLRHGFPELERGADAGQRLGSGVPAFGLRGGLTVARVLGLNQDCLLYTSPSPRDRSLSRMPSSA